jgi:hypothetical protein
MSTDKVIARIKKMMSMAKGTAVGGEAERETAMKMADVCPWRWSVAYSLANLYFCEYFSTQVPGKQRKNLHFVGLESNVQTAKEMTAYAIKSIYGQSVKTRKESGQTAAAAFETSFCNAAAAAIFTRR